MAERASGANRADDRCSASRMVWTMLFQTCWACPHAVDPLTFFSTDLARCVQGISRSEIIAPYVSESSPLVMCLAASIRTSLFVGRLRTFGVKHLSVNLRIHPKPPAAQCCCNKSQQKTRRFPPSDFHPRYRNAHVVKSRTPTGRSIDGEPCGS